MKTPIQHPVSFLTAPSAIPVPFPWTEADLVSPEKFRDVLASKAYADFFQGWSKAAHLRGDPQSQIQFILNAGGFDASSPASFYRMTAADVLTMIEKSLLAVSSWDYDPVAVFELLAILNAAVNMCMARFSADEQARVDPALSVLTQARTVYAMRAVRQQLGLSCDHN